MARSGAARLHETDRFLAGSPPTIGAVDDEVVTRELGFAVGLLRRATFRREVQQVCVELGLGCEIDERRRLLTTRVRVLVRGSREGVDALVDYARVSGWSTWTDDALGSSLG
jgi:ABC-type tungstate transport system substrate-binding protein